MTEQLRERLYDYADGLGTGMLVMHDEDISELVALLKGAARALAQQPAAVDALAGLDNIAGYFQDGSEETLLVTPDDATRTWHVYVGKHHLGYGKSIRAALTAALAAQKEGVRDALA